MILRQLKDITIQNKYTKWYCNIISAAMERVVDCKYFSNKKKFATDKVGYIEAHHIIPSSINKELSKDKRNLAFLTAKEHFICHLLLPKMLSSEYYKRKMKIALVWMSNRLKLNSVNYSRTRQSILKSLGAYHVEKLNADPNYRYKLVEPLLRAQKLIDHSTEEWLNRSIRSLEAIEKSKTTLQSDSHREYARQRELAKGADKLSELGKARRAKQLANGIAKYGSEEAVYKAHADKIKGRVKLTHKITGAIKYVKDPGMEWSYILNISNARKRNTY